MEIGSLVLNHEDERGRDFAQEVFTVSYKGKVICQSSDARARASRFDKPWRFAKDLLKLSWKC